MFKTNLITDLTKLLVKCSITNVTPLSPPLLPCTIVPVRHRWWATRPTVLRRFGYEDKLEVRGLLPRTPDYTRRLPIPPYVPKNKWTEKKAVFGQNDYIDILGDGSIHPSQITYGVPTWLRGFHGNEYQMLLRKRKYFGQSMARKIPDSFNSMEKRIRYLTKYLNRKRRFRAGHMMQT